MIRCSHLHKLVETDHQQCTYIRILFLQWFLQGLFQYRVEAVKAAQAAIAELLQ